MSEVYTNVTIKMPTELDYVTVEFFVKNQFDDEDHWPVESYDKNNLSITIEEVIATKDDVVGFAKVLNEQICKVASDQKAGIKEKMEKISYSMYGTTTYPDCDEQVDYIIEKKDKETTVKETEHYTFFGSGHFSDYAEFCDNVGEICPNARKLIDEDKFDTDCEYAVTFSKVYVDETPEYGTPYPIEDYDEDGKIYSANDEIIAYLKENNLPYDDETIANLSVDDVYAIMEGTYGK